MKLCKPVVAVLLVAAVAVGPMALAQGGGKNKPATTTSTSSTSTGSTGSVNTTSSSSAPGGSATPVSSGAVPATTGSSAVAGPSSARAATPAAGMDGQTYVVRLRDLEQRVDELKEQIRRSHTRLSLLSDTVLTSGVGGSRSDIQFQNEMSSAFRVIRVLIVLDGAVQYNKADESGTLSDQPIIPIFAGSIPPGDHTVQVLLQLQGNGYGVFSYLKGYKFEVRSTHSFTAVDGKRMGLQIIAYEKGGVTTPLEERPAVRFLEKVATGLQSPPPSGDANASRPVAPSSVSTGFSVGAGSK